MLGVCDMVKVKKLYVCASYGTRRSIVNHVYMKPY